LKIYWKWKGNPNWAHELGWSLLACSPQSFFGIKQTTPSIGLRILDEVIPCAPGLQSNTGCLTMHIPGKRIIGEPELFPWSRSLQIMDRRRNRSGNYLLDQPEPCKKQGRRVLQVGKPW